MLINRETNRKNKPIFRLAQQAGDLSSFTFDWKQEIKKDDSEVWRLSVASNKHTIAYISLLYDVNFVKINLIERERYNEKPLFYNIGQTLISFACLRSAEEGFDGIVVFTAKTRLIEWYKKQVFAQRIGNSDRMVIFEEDALKLAISEIIVPPISVMLCQSFRRSLCHFR